MQGETTKNADAAAMNVAMETVCSPSPNNIIEGDGFYISYNETDTSIYGGETTALVRGQMEAFYILNGDHRHTYSLLMENGFDACLSYFKGNLALINARSERA